jgi:hypothetical protein
MRWIGLALFVAIPACYPVSNVCSETLQPVISSDAGMAPCIQASDCPRQGEQGNCLTDGLPTMSCVSCDQNLCVLHVVVPCQ